MIDNALWTAFGFLSVGVVSVVAMAVTAKSSIEGED